MSTSVDECVEMSALNDDEKVLGDGTKFQIKLKNHMKAINKTITQVKMCYVRMDRSTNKRSLSEELEVVHHLQLQLDVGLGALRVMTSPSASHNEIVSAIKAAEEAGVKISKTMAIVMWYQAHRAKTQSWSGSYLLSFRPAGQLRIIEGSQP